MAVNGTGAPADETLCFTPATELRAGYATGELAPLDVVEAVIRRIDRLNPTLHAFITLTPELARAAAAKPPTAEATLAGIPITVKDLTDTAGVPTSYGDPAFADHVPEHDAPVWARAKAAGAAIVGKTSTPPYGWLGVTENDIVGITGNPWSLDRVSGGSSGGAAAAIAAGLAPIAIGSDGGGSIRIPAACCGVVGLKPSHGRVPRGPEEMPFCTVGAVGPLARTVADVALLLSVIAGPLEDEPYMLPEVGVDYVADLRATSVAGVRIAYSPDLGRGPVDPEVAAIVRAAVQRFGTDLRGEVEEVAIRLPDPIDHFRTYWAPALVRLEHDMPEFAAGFHRKYPFHRELAAVSGDVTLQDFWSASMNSRAETFRAIARLFAEHAFLLLPTMPVAPFPHAGKMGGPTHIGGEAVKWPAIEFHRLTEPFSHTGHPAITVPCGFTADGLPAGLQIVGRQRDDAGVLRLAAAWEAIAPWSGFRPACRGIERAILP